MVNLYILYLKVIQNKCRRKKTPIAEDKPAVTTPTTTVTGEGGDSDTRVGTVIGKTGKGKTPMEESVASKTQAVLSGLQQNTPKSTLSKAFQSVSKGLMGAMMPGIGLLGGLGIGAKSALGDQGTSTQGLADALGSVDAAQGIGYDAQGNVTVSGPMASVMGIQGVMNELSKAAYGKSYDVMTQELGVQPSFQYGYKPGDVDPSTNATYSVNGQATDDDNNVSYTDMNAFGNAMNASAKSGYFGGEKQAKEDAKKNNPNAKAFLGYLNKNRKYGKNVALDVISDKEFGDDSGPGPGDGGGATGDPDDDDSAATDTGTADATGTAGQAAAGSSQTDSGPGSDDNPDATDNSESGTGDAESMGDDALVGTALREGEIVSVYSIEKCIEILMADGMDHQEAEEFFYYNTHDAYIGNKTPMYINTHNEGE